MEQINMDKRQVINSIISSLIPNEPLLNGTVSAAAEKNNTTEPITTTPFPSTTSSIIEPTFPTTTSRSTTSSYSTTSTFSSTTSSTTTSSTSIAKGTTITKIITPTTVIIIGTATISSALPAITSLSTDLPDSSNDSGGLSSGAKIGIIAGSVIGGIAFIVALFVLCMVAKRNNKRKGEAKDDIRWPEIVASADDRAALYPEQTHATGRAGIGGDDMEEVGNRAGMTSLGAGAAGIGATYAGVGRYNSQNDNSRSIPSRQIPSTNSMNNNSTIYSDMMAPSPSLSQSQSQSQYSSNTPYSYGGSQQSHVPMLPAGPASSDYHQRNSPSPPQIHTGSSSQGDEDLSSSGPASLPYPGDVHSRQSIDRPLSPTPMQVGGNNAFGNGYDESSPGRYRLSVVNDDH